MVIVEWRFRRYGDDKVGDVVQLLDIGWIFQIVNGFIFYKLYFYNCVKGVGKYCLRCYLKVFGY